MLGAVIYVLLALLLIGVAISSYKTGFVGGKSLESNGRTTRENHPIFFWMIVIPSFNAGVFFAVMAFLFLSDAIGLTNVIGASE